jgi:molybdate transport system substrate-binding protein
MLKQIMLGSLFIIQTLYGGTINIAVATNVSYAMPTLIKEFNKLYPDTKVRIILGGSGKLTAQIKNGAPYHIFMSANMKYPLSLYNNEVAINKPVIYASGSLAYFSSKKQDFSAGMKLLEAQSIKKIAVANPKTAPYGKASVEAMKNAGVYKRIVNKLVYGESISQTLSYAVTATDIGFIAKSALYSPKMSKYKKGINYLDVDQKLYKPINQGIIILKNAKGNSEVSTFYNFMLSDKAKKILNNFGYIVP